jgi:hypothetical protein
MSARYCIDEAGVSTKPKNGPASVTVTDRAYFRVLSLERLCDSFDLWKADFFGVAADKSLEVKCGPLYWVSENFGGDYLAAKAG